MASPVLTASTFDLYDYGTEGAADSQDCMTVKGTAFKAILCSLIVLCAAILVHCAKFDCFTGIIAVLAVLFTTTAGFCYYLRCNPKKGIVLAPLFSAVQGIILGLLSKTVLAGILPFLLVGCVFGENTENFMALFEFDQCYFNEVFFSSACIVIVMSLACISGITKAKHSTALIIIGDVLGVLLFYLGALLAAVLGIFNVIAHSGPGYYCLCGVCGSLICLPVAYSLAVDFDNIRIGSLSKVPSYMEWYCVFALIFSLTWSYIEIVRVLIAMLRDAFSRSERPRGW